MYRVDHLAEMMDFESEAIELRIKVRVAVSRARWHRHMAAAQAAEKELEKLNAPLSEPDRDPAVLAEIDTRVDCLNCEPFDYGR